MTEAEVSSRRRLPVIWLVPVVAVALGIYMVVYTVMTEGPEITITFETALGIEAGRTKLSSRSVEVGLVEAVTLNEDLDSVSVIARLERENTKLLRDDTRFWVVRPRLGAGGISGLNTLLSGAYIELEPGSGAPSTRRDFVGLDDVPVTAVGTPGLGLVLVSKRAGIVSPGQPVLHNGYRVGRVESTTFIPDTGQVRHGVFIEAPFDVLVNQATRFWDAGGIVVRTGAGGLLVDVESLQALLIGGVAFGGPKGSVPQGTRRVRRGVRAPPGPPERNRAVVRALPGVRGLVHAVGPRPGSWGARGVPGDSRRLGRASPDRACHGSESSG